MPRLAKVRLHNFKGKRLEWAIGPKTLLVGPNGAGKSAILQALMVGVLGYEPRLGRAPASVAQLASGREMSVELETEGKFILRRAFKMTEGMVSTSVHVSPCRGERNLADAHRRILEELGDFAVVFDLNAFLTLSDAKKRSYLFGLSPMKSLGWDRGRIQSQLVLIARAPVSSLVLYGWIEKAFSVWSESEESQSNLGRMLIYLKKEFSLWSLRKKEGLSAARRMIVSRNQESFSSSTGSTTKKEIDEMTERIIRIREEWAKDGERRKWAEARAGKIEAIRRRMEEVQTSSFDDSVDQIEARLTELRGRSFDYEAMRKKIEEMEREAQRLKSEIDLEERKNNNLQAALETEERNRARVREAHGVCPVMEGVQCPVDFTSLISGRGGALMNQAETLAALQRAQEERRRRYASRQEAWVGLKTKLQSLMEGEKETESQITAWEEVLRRRQRGLDDREETLKQLQTELASLIEEEASDGGYADPDDLTLQREALERSLEEKKRLLSEQEAQKSIWIAYQRNQVEIKKADANLEALKRLIAALGPKGLQGEMMKELIRPFSKIVNELLQSIDPRKRMEFRFQDDRGNEVFEMGWMKGERFIRFETLSTGERLLFSAALMTAMILFRGPRLRLLLVDNLESIDAFHRLRFIQALSAFVDEGHLDHFIAAGVEGIPLEEGDRLGLRVISMPSPQE